MKKRTQITWILLLLFVASMRTTFAQNSNAINHPGAFIYFNSQLKFTASPSLTDILKKTSKNKNISTSVLQKATTLSSVLLEAPTVSPLTGFNLMPNIHPVQYDGFLGVNIKYFIFPFYNDKQTGKIVQARRWGADIEIAVNNPGILFNSYFNRTLGRCFENSHRDMGAYGRYDGTSPFYYKNDMHRDANGFWIIKGIKTINAARIIEKEGIPLIIPVTQERYIKFIISMERLYIKKANKAIAHNKISLKYAEKSEDQSEIEAYEEILKNNRAYISDLEKAIEGNQSELNRMSNEQLNAKAYVNFYKDSHSIHRYNILTSRSDKDGDELVMVNPAYFDKSLPKNEVQLVVVAYHGSSRAVAPAIMEKLKTWFNQIDYAMLQSMIK